MEYISKRVIAISIPQDCAYPTAGDVAPETTITALTTPKALSYDITWKCFFLQITICGKSNGYCRIDMSSEIG